MSLTEITAKVSTNPTDKANRSARLATPGNRGNYHATIERRAEAFGLVPTTKGKPRKRATQSQHDIEVLHLILNAANAPSCPNYVASLFVMKDQADENGILEVTDRRLAEALACGGSGRTHAQAITANMRRIRDERRVLEQWQVQRDEENGLQHITLIHRKIDYDANKKRNHSVYDSIPLFDIFDSVNRVCGPNSTKKFLKEAVLSLLGEVAKEQDLKKWDAPKTRTSTPEAELNRGLSLITKACGLETIRSGEEGALRLLRDALAKAEAVMQAKATNANIQNHAETAKIDSQLICTLFARLIVDKSHIINNLTLLGCDGFRNTLPCENDTAYESYQANHEETNAGDTLSLLRSVTQKEAHSESSFNQAHAVSLELGQPMADFVATNPAYQPAQSEQPTPKQIRTLKLFRVFESGLTFAEASARIAELRARGAEPMASDRQRELLTRVDVNADSLTMREASERISEAYANGAFLPGEWLSLSELRAYDPKARQSGTKQRYRCPMCSDGRTKRKQRCLRVNLTKNRYSCFHCGTWGFIKESFTGAASIPVRQFPALPKPEPTPEEIEQANRWRRWFEAAQLIQANEPSRGVEYLASRGIPAAVAETAGARFGLWWFWDDEAEQSKQLPAVIFPMKNQFGELVAASARAIVSNGKNTRGEKMNALFLTEPDALKTTPLIVCEGPIDALALATCGYAAAAMVGTYGPEWLAESPTGGEVVTATDADAAGDLAAETLTELLAGQAITRRARPIGGKDWAEVLQLHGAASVQAQIECALGCAELGSFDDVEVF